MPRREQGYAMIAAVAAVAAFGYIALGALKDGRAAIASAGADLARARMSADADAGIAIAIHDLGLADPNRRWRLTGPARQVDWQGARLTITVEDENGKLPLNFLRKDQLQRLFSIAGAEPSPADSMAAAFIDLRGDPQPGGAPQVNARFAGQRGPLTSLDELMLLPGMTPALYARIAPAATVHASTLAFDPRTASPLALAVMSPGSAATPEAIEQARERAGQRAAFDAPAPIELTHRVVTIRVDVDDDAGGALRRTAIVEFTGSAARPYVMRGLE
jgi:general secretion pathway protein K